MLNKYGGLGALNELINEIQKISFQCSKLDLPTFAIRWVRGCLGCCSSVGIWMKVLCIPGNEQVDDLAKLAVYLDTSEEPMFFKDLKSSINEHLTNLWQNRWSQSSPNKFLEILPDLNNW